MTKPALAPILAALVACGGNPANQPAEPAEPTEQAGEPAAQTAALAVAPFVLTITGTRSDGITKTRILRGSADGVITAERDGETREVLRVSGDGTFTSLREGHTAVARLAADGTLTVNGEVAPRVRVGDDGTVYRDDRPMLEIEGSRVVDLSGDVMTSRVSMNGKVVSETRYEMTVEGGDEVRRLVGALLLLQMAGGEPQPASEQSSPASIEPEPVPVPAPSRDIQE